MATIGRAGFDEKTSYQKKPIIIAAIINTTAVDSAEDNTKNSIGSSCQNR